MVFCLVLAAFVLSAVLVFLTIKLCRRFSLYDEVDPRKIHKGNIPRMGGVGIFVSFFAVSAVFMRLSLPGTFSFAAPVFAGLILIFIFGLLDDIFNLPAKLKFLVQAVAAIIVVFGSSYLRTLFWFELSPLAGKILTFFWILACVNAFNLIDGIDWLCSGISLFSIATLGAIQVISGREAAALYFILAGCVAGFMVWNRPPAKIFLGDVGSQTLGFVIATFPFLYSESRDFEFQKLLMLILLASIPLTDVVAAVWRRGREHRPLFAPDRAHIHHKLLNVGFSRLAAIGFLFLVQALVCVSIIGSCYLRPKHAIMLLSIVLAFVELIFIAFHYLNRMVNRRGSGMLEDHPQAEH